MIILQQIRIEMYNTGEGKEKGREGERKRGREKEREREIGGGREYHIH